MFASTDWRSYWHDMPMITSYEESILRHESRFTPYFPERGFTLRRGVPGDRLPLEHPVIENAVQMLRDGCPIVKRRSFFHDPLYHERNAIDGRQVMRADGRARLPDRPDLAQPGPHGRSRARWPRTWTMLEVLPDVDLGYDPTSRRGSR